MRNKEYHYQFWFGPLNYDVYVVYEVHKHPLGDVELPIKAIVDSALIIGDNTCLFETTTFNTSDPDKLMTIIAWSESQAKKHKFY